MFILTTVHFGIDAVNDIALSKFEAEKSLETIPFNFAVYSVV